MSQSIEIAKIIAGQIGMRTMMALGAKNRVALNETDTRRGGLQFDASLFGRKQCRVRVELTAADLYRVKVLRARSEAVISDLGDQVFCEDLSGMVETAVEKFFAQ